MIFHVTPIGDKKQHIESEVCECNPSVQVVEGDMICVHNSFGVETNEIKK